MGKQHDLLYVKNQDLFEKNYAVRKILILDPASSAVKVKHSYHYKQTAFTRDVEAGERLQIYNYSIPEKSFGKLKPDEIW